MYLNHFKQQYNTDYTRDYSYLLYTLLHRELSKITNSGTACFGSNHAVITVFEEIGREGSQEQVLVFHEQELRLVLESLGPVQVVTLFGAVGTGKSTLENLLIGEEVFAPGHTEKCQTRGIQIYVKRSSDPSVPSQIFMDTQGTGRKGNRDPAILWLCHMVSSVLVYNIKDKLHRNQQQLILDIEVSKLMQQSVNSYLQQHHSNISIKTAFENMILVQRDAQPDWSPLHTQVQMEHDLQEVANFLKPENCISFPCPAPDVPKDFKQLQQALTVPFKKSLTALQKVIKDNLANSVPFQGADLFRNWAALWQAIENPAFDSFRKNQVQVYMDQYYARKKGQYRTYIKKLLGSILNDGPKSFAEVMALKDPPANLKKEMELLPEGIVRNLTTLYACEWERVMELNIQQNIDECFKALKEKAQSGQVDDQIQLETEMKTSEARVMDKMKGIQDIKRFFSYFCDAMQRIKNIIQQAADYYFRQHFISEDYLISRFRRELSNSLQAPNFKSHQTFQETPLNFTPNPATNRDQYKIEWSGGGRTSLGKSKAVYATVKDSQGNVITGGAARHNDQRAALDQANSNLDEHLQKMQQQDATRMAQESEQHQAAQQQARDAVAKQNADIDRENQQLQQNYDSAFYGQLANDFMWSGVRSLRTSIIYVAVNPKQFNTKKKKIYFILSQSVIGGVAGVILPRVVTKTAELVLEKTVLKTLQEKAPAMLGSLVGVRGISILISTLITITVHKMKQPEIPLQDIIKTSCGNSTVSFIIGMLPYGMLVETLADITFAFGPWNYLFKDHNPVENVDTRSEQQHDEFLQSLVATLNGLAEVALVGANPEEDSFFVNVGFRLFQLGKLQKNPTEDATATAEMREAVCNWMNANKGFRLGETEATSVSLQAAWGQDFEKRVQSLHDARVKVDPLIIWVVTEVYGTTKVFKRL